MSNSNNFPSKLHFAISELERKGKDHIISWHSDGRTFLVHDADLLEKEVLPFWFRQTKYSSFRRQLNIYGFTRTINGMDRAAYSHPCFVREKPQLSKRIERAPIKRVSASSSLKITTTKKTASPSSRARPSPSSPLVKKPDTSSSGDTLISGIGRLLQQHQQQQQHPLAAAAFQSKLQQHRQRMVSTAAATHLLAPPPAAATKTMGLQAQLLAQQETELLTTAGHRLQQSNLMAPVGPAVDDPLACLVADHLQTLQRQKIQSLFASAAAVPPSFMGGPFSFTAGSDMSQLSALLLSSYAV